MLQYGAAHVTAVDTGYGQIAEPLRRDPRVTLHERTNARYLKPGELGETIDFVSMDVSFISATLVLPAVLGALRGPATRAIDTVILVKPQFEAGREHIGKGGIVTDPAAHQLAHRPRARRRARARGSGHRPHRFTPERRHGKPRVSPLRAFLKGVVLIAYTKLHATRRHHL